MNELQTLPVAVFARLADKLPDRPDTVIATSQLRRGLANAWLIGDVDAFETAVIEDLCQPGEPLIFSQSAAQVAAVMSAIPGWDCLNVPLPLVDELVPLIEKQMGCPVRLWADMYHTLTTPVPSLAQAYVRPLTMDDRPLLEAAALELQGPYPQRALEEMMVVGAVINGRLAAVAQFVARSAAYGEIGVHTLAPYRGRNLATTAAAVVAGHIQSQGLIPVWSCGENNAASRRVARKLGFAEVGRRMYIILDR